VIGSGRKRLAAIAASKGSVKLADRLLDRDLHATAAPT
jgi:hypothetical protein